MNVQPSRIARYVAGRTWGTPVQSSQMLSHGVYSFDTPGHGGIVAVVPAVREDAEHGFNPAALAAARATGRIERVAILIREEHRQRVKFYGTSGEFRPGQLAEFAARHRMELCDVWIGEEDCAYAPLLLACKPARVKWNRLLSSPEADDAAAIDYLRGVCQRWESDFLEHYDPEGVTA